MKKYSKIFLIWLFYFVLLSITFYLFTESFWSSILKGLFTAAVCTFVTYLILNFGKKKKSLRLIHFE